jgi:signal transduction histidine kinase
MKEFSHPGSDQKRLISLSKAIDSTLNVCRSEWKYVADVETDIPEDLPPVPCFPGQLNQVFLNIVVNAAHAITAKVGTETSTKGRIGIVARQLGDDVEIRLSDTGCGIPKSAQARVFEPFFTTKEVGKGTGQGLSVAYNVVVEKHGGTIDFETSPEQGTTFIIRLPLESCEAGADSTSTHQAGRATS